MRERERQTECTERERANKYKRERERALLTKLQVNILRRISQTQAVSTLVVGTLARNEMRGEGGTKCEGREEQTHAILFLLYIQTCGFF